MKLNLITVLIFLLSLLSFSNKNKKESNPIFIIILVDDQGWNGTSVQMMDNEINSKSDFYQTPNIEKLAKKGIRFSSAYASAPSYLQEESKIIYRKASQIEIDKWSLFRDKEESIKVKARKFATDLRLKMKISCAFI